MATITTPPLPHPLPFITPPKRDAFYRHLRTLTFPRRIDIRSTFTQSESLEITQFFCNDIFSLSGLARLLSFLNTAPNQLAIANPVPAVTISTKPRAAQLVGNQTIPTALQHFLTLYTEAENLEKVNAGKDNGIRARIRLLQKRLNLYNHWATLQIPTPDLLSFLQNRGIAVSDLKAKYALNAFLAHQLNLPSSKEMVNHIRKVEGMAALCEGFGSGVLVLLPEGVNLKIRAWGRGRFKTVVEVLLEIAPELSRVYSEVPGLQSLEVDSPNSSNSSTSPDYSALNIHCGNDANDPDSWEIVQYTREGTEAGDEIVSAARAGGLFGWEIVPSVIEGMKGGAKDENLNGNETDKDGWLSWAWRRGR